MSATVFILCLFGAYSLGALSGIVWCALVASGATHGENR